MKLAGREKKVKPHNEIIFIVTDIINIVTVSANQRDK